MIRFSANLGFLWPELPLLEDISEIFAWARGELRPPASRNPFAGQHARLVRAIPDAEAQSLVAAMARPVGAAPPSPEQAGPAAPQTPADRGPSTGAAGTTGPGPIVPPGSGSVTPPVIAAKPAIPPIASPDLSAAETLLVQGRYREALVAFERVLQTSPQSVGAWLGRVIAGVLGLMATSLLGSLLVSIVGACALIGILKAAGVLK